MHNEVTIITSSVVPSTCTALVPYTGAVVVMALTEKAELNQLITETRALRLRGRELRIAIGHNLLRIQAIKAKPGHGSFVKTVTDEIGMPVATAYDYMREASEAEGLYEIRNDAPGTDVVPYDRNDGQPDEVAKAIAEHEKLLEEAESAERDANRPRMFNWKFSGLSMELADELKAAKAKLGSVNAALILINAAKEVADEASAA